MARSDVQETDSELLEMHNVVSPTLQSPSSLSLAKADAEQSQERLGIPNRHQCTSSTTTLTNGSIDLRDDHNRQPNMMSDMTLFAVREANFEVKFEDGDEEDPRNW